MPGSSSPVNRTFVSGCEGPRHCRIALRRESCSVVKPNNLILSYLRWCACPPAATRTLRQPLISGCRVVFRFGFRHSCSNWHPDGTLLHVSLLVPSGCQFVNSITTNQAAATRTLRYAAHARGHLGEPGALGTREAGGAAGGLFAAGCSACPPLSPLWRVGQIGASKEDGGVDYPQQLARHGSLGSRRWFLTAGVQRTSTVRHFQISDRL